VVIDRIELGTYMLAPAIAGGEVELLGGRIDLIGAFVEKLRRDGVSVTETQAGLKVERASDRAPGRRCGDRTVPRLSRPICRRR
jgi:UDP-N-acetylglucosamine 1-carboxyvinyltransferase